MPSSMRLFVVSVLYSLYNSLNAFTDRQAVQPAYLLLSNMIDKLPVILYYFLNNIQTRMSECEVQDMTRKNILWLILDLILLLIFNLLFFVVGSSPRPASVWISYIFIHLACILMIATPILVRGGKTLFGLSLASIATAYFLVEFIVGVIFVLLRSESYKTALVFQLILTGVYALLLLAKMIANENNSTDTGSIVSGPKYVKVCLDKLSSIMDMTQNRGLSKRIERAYDIVRKSPSKTTSSTAPLERQIDGLIDALTSDLRSENIKDAEKKVERIINLAEERNRLL